MNIETVVPHNESPTPDRVLRSLEWHVVRRLDGILQGDYRSLFFGRGLEIAELREYQMEDDIRTIDWNVTARMNAPYVRQYTEDREITAWFLLDLSSSMKFGAPGRPKESVMLDFIATLMRLLTRNGNRVGAIFFNKCIEQVISPRGGRPQVLRIINELLNREPSSGGSMTDLRPLFETAFNVIKRPSLVFVVSDFVCLPGWERPLQLLSRRHDLLPVRLWDQREVELPDAGIILVEDSETGEQLTVDTRDKELRRRFLEAAQRREVEMGEIFGRAGVAPLSVSTEEDFVQAILRFATLRKRIPRQRR